MKRAAILLIMASDLVVSSQLGKDSPKSPITNSPSGHSLMVNLGGGDRNPDERILPWDVLGLLLNDSDDVPTLSPDFFIRISFPWYVQVSLLLILVGSMVAGILTSDWNDLCDMFDVGLPTPFKYIQIMFKI